MREDCRTSKQVFLPCSTVAVLAATLFSLGIQATSLAQGGLTGCCGPNGNCMNVQPSQCAAIGGTSLPLGNQCSPREACCFAAGNCLDVAPECCTILGGTPLGVGSMCQGDLDGDGHDDVCPQDPGCVVQPGANQCPNTMCPVQGDFCRPTEIVHDPIAGTYQITKCDCLWDGDCHIDVFPGATPVCRKQCPNNLDCAIFTTQNADGTETMKCDCSPMCQPLPPPAFGCTPINCPDADSTCRPIKVTFHPSTGQYVVNECDCTNDDRCHVVLDPADPVGPHCEGICPAGQDCTFNTVDNADGSITHFCDCQSVPACNTCCGAKPTFTGFPGTIAFNTIDRGTAADFVVNAIDFSGQGAAPIASPDWTPTFYNHATWNKGSLGSVFGVTIDHLGNAYVAQTSSYGLSFGIYSDALGTLAGGVHGGIYKINAATGAASLWVNLPNTIDTTITPVSEAWPELGNLAFNCPVQRMYVTNFSDGRIYNLNTAGTTVQSYDHATGIVYTGTAPDINDNPNTFAPLGERVWAVQPSQGRLYYSVWWEDQGRPNPGQQNQIWSVGLTGAGDFIPGSAQLEIVMGDIWSGAGYSNPVSDITFTPNCCMIVAERSMEADTFSWAHQSRAIEFCPTTTGTWVPSGTPFQIGGGGNNSSGGIDYDYDSVNSVFQVWVTGDYLITYGGGPAWVYGIQGLPSTGGTTANSTHIDSDQNTAFQDKFQQGDVEVTCPGCSPNVLVACCTPDHTCTNLDPICCQQEGGIPGPAGALCGSIEECCFPDGTNQIMDAACCIAAGGTPQGPGTGTVSLAPGACCLPPGDPLGPCAFINPLCCSSRGGTFLGFFVMCTDNDANGNGLNDSCDPQCEPLPSGFGCTDSVCPVPPPGEKCRPSEVICDNFGNCRVTECDCTGLDECKLKHNGPGHFYCEGICLTNPALHCELYKEQTAAGVRFYCDCLGDPIVEACCLPDGSCAVMTADQCTALGGTPLGVGSSCLGVEACCFTDATGVLACQDMDKLCCEKFYSGSAQGPGSMCQGDNNGNGIDDECEPPGCEPPPPGVFTCPSVQCPQQGDKCQPKCIDFDIVNDIFTVSECECSRPGECYATLGSDTPNCIGNCDTDEICTQTATVIAPGVTRYCCHCESAPPDCEPTIDRTRCKPHDCPNDNEVCIPKCMLFDGFNTTVEDCECRRQEECHPVASTIVPPLAPSCDGFCPPGYNCIETVTTDGLPPGLSRICCECEPMCPLPDPTADDPCAFYQATSCVDGSPHDLCMANLVHIGPGPLDGPWPYVDDCTCTNPIACSPVTLTPIPGTLDYNLSCIGDCFPPEVGKCQVEINGVPTGVQTVFTGDLSFNDIITCGCGDPPIDACPLPTPPAVDICALRQPYDCRKGLDSDHCFPTKIVWNPATGQATAESCECMSQNDCHVVYEGGFGLPPTCGGICPQTGDQCTPTIVNNPDGTQEFSCDCCPPNDVTINISTGVTQSGGFIPVGNNDDTWTVVAAPIGSPPYPPKVINPHPAWLTIPGTQWISAAATGPNGTYDYQYCFCLADDYENAYLTFLMRADDKATLYFNGYPIVSTPPSYSFSTSPPVGVSLIGYFQAGTNCIDVIVENTHGVVTGLNLWGEVHADNGQCCCEPEPGGFSCKPTTCPNPNEVCRPTKYECIPGGLCHVTECDCMGPNGCHAEISPLVGGGVFCTGGCPAFGQTCQRTDNELANGTIESVCSCGIICDDPTDCNDSNACTCDSCVSGGCVNTPVTYGNVNCIGPAAPNLDDILCVLNGFANFSACRNGDIHPCTGDNIINLDDILKVLAAFSGNDACGCP